MSTKLVNNIVFGKKFCRLCFSDVYDDDLRFHDEVILNMKSEKISSMLINILGGKYTSSMRVSDIFCNICVQALKNSYNFIKMCENNSERLEKTVVTLNEALQSAECSETSKSVLIQIDTTDYSFMQFYQYQRTVKFVSPSEIRGRSKYLISSATATKKNKTSALVGYVDISEDQAVPKKNTKKPVLLKNSHTKHSSKTRAKCSLEEQQKKLKLLIQNQSQYNLRKHRKPSEKNNQTPEEEVKPEKKLTRKERNKIIKLATKKLLRIKTERKKFVCDECKKTFNHRSCIVYHMQNIHSLCQPFVCEFCDNAFRTAHKLKYHIRKYHVHLSAQCDICNARFKQLGSVYKHRKRHFNPKSPLYIEKITK